MRATFHKKGKKGQKNVKKRTKKSILFENLGKNVQKLKIFGKRAGGCVRLSHAINY